MFAKCSIWWWHRITRTLRSHNLGYSSFSLSGITLPCSCFIFHFLMEIELTDCSTQTTSSIRFLNFFSQIYGFFLISTKIHFFQHSGQQCNDFQVLKFYVAAVQEVILDSSILNARVRPQYFYFKNYNSIFGNKQLKMDHLQMSFI